MKKVFKQIDWDEWKKGNYIPIAALSISPEELEKRYNIKFFEDYDDLDYFKAALIKINNNKYYSFLHYKGEPDNNTNILIKKEICDRKKEVIDLLNILGIDVSLLSWVEE